MKFILLFLFTIQFSLIFSQFSIGHTTITFNDPARTGGTGSGGGPGRQIQTEIYYPSAVAGTDVPVMNGSFPLIVFGHGFVITWQAYQNIWEHYVSLGYVVAFPVTESGLPDHADFGLDLSQVEQKIQALNASPSSLFFQKLNGNSAIAGHSMGGGASVLAGQSNTSVKTIVAFAPAETTPSAISAASSVIVPTVIFSGSSDGVTPPVDNHIPIYNALGSACKTFVSIIGGAHCYFANSNTNCDLGEFASSTGITVTRSQQQQLTFSVLDVWFDYILKGNTTSGVDFMNIIATPPSGLNIQSTCSNLNTDELSDVELEFYPNPTTGWVKVRNSTNETLVAKVFSLDGKERISVQFKDEIDLTGLENGLYFIAVQGRIYSIAVNK